MHSKHTTLFTRLTTAGNTAPSDAYVVTYNAQSGRLQEYGPDRPIPSGAAGLHFFTVPVAPVETLFAVKGAITCARPDGRDFQPGFCMNLRLEHISPIGLQKLLQTCSKNGRVPDCLSLEAFQLLLAEDIRAICKRAAEAFSRSQTLSYTHWWQDLKFGTAYRDLLYMPLMQLFNAYGFRLDKNAFRICGLAPVPLA